MNAASTHHLGILLGLALGLGITSPTWADDEADERASRAREIAESINSPFCPASTLASCTSPHAQEWRSEIRGWVDEGLTKNEICARLEERVNHQLCVGPRQPWTWSLPFLIAAGAIAMLAWLLRSFVRPEAGDEPEADASTTAVVDEELDAQLDRELDELDD